jgi:hypothetical protein
MHLNSQSFPIYCILIAILIYVAHYKQLTVRTHLKHLSQASHYFLETNNHYYEYQNQQHYTNLLNQMKYLNDFSMYLMYQHHLDPPIYSHHTM